MTHVTSTILFVSYLERGHMGRQVLGSGIFIMEGSVKGQVLKDVGGEQQVRTVGKIKPWGLLGHS